MGIDVNSDVIKRLKSGDRHAFDELYWQYHQPIYKNIFKFIKEEEESLDILQDVFTTLWEKRASIDAGQPLSGWLFVVSFNKTMNRLKKMLKESGYRQQAAQMNEADIDPDEIQYELLEKALTQLSPQKRRVFELCKLEGKSYEQAAVALNISKHTVKEYLSAAMTSVKAFVRNHPDYTGTAALLVFVKQFL